MKTAIGKTSMLRGLLPLLFLLLSACSLMQPDEDEMRAAIASHVGRAEDYPMAFVTTDAFVFSNLKKIHGQDALRYSVDAGFDFVYGADGSVIVATLKAAEREKAAKQRPGNSLLRDFAQRVRGVFMNQEFELRYGDVKAGDRDHYQGTFTLVRNEDGSWRVAQSDYK